MSQMIELEFQSYIDPVTGVALGNGLVYVGVAGSDPTQEINQIPLTLRQENGDEVATAQPVVLGGGGIPEYNGSPAQIMTVEDDYAVAVHDKNDAQVYYVGTRLINAEVAETAANVAITEANVVLTNADVVLTHADVVLTNADVVLTNADVVLTGEDVILSETAAVAAGLSADEASASAEEVILSEGALTRNMAVRELTTETSSSDISWYSVVWAEGIGMFVAVARTTGVNSVMTSMNGMTWATQVAISGTNGYRSVVWAESLSLLVAGGTDGEIMTSPDGLNWTSRTSPLTSIISGEWSEDLDLFVLAGNNQIATSPDGITWDTRTSPNDTDWEGGVWSPDLSLFVFVGSANGGGEKTVMTSPDGLTWTGRDAGSTNDFTDVAWSDTLSLFTAIASSDDFYTSPDGITWTLRSRINNAWQEVVWASQFGMFIMVAISGTNNRVATSIDGINWVYQANTTDNEWRSITWSASRSLLIAVSSTGTADRVMRSL